MKYLAILFGIALFGAGFSHSLRLRGFVFYVLGSLCLILVLAAIGAFYEAVH